MSPSNRIVVASIEYVILIGFFLSHYLPSVQIVHPQYDVKDLIWLYLQPIYKAIFIQLVEAQRYMM